MTAATMITETIGSAPWSPKMPIARVSTMESTPSRNNPAAASVSMRTCSAVAGSRRQPACSGSYACAVMGRT